MQGVTDLAIKFQRVMPVSAVQARGLWQACQVEEDKMDNLLRQGNPCCYRHKREMIKARERRLTRARERLLDTRCKG